jgi:hypothetical protein
MQKPLAFSKSSKSKASIKERISEVKKDVKKDI